MKIGLRHSISQILATGTDRVGARYLQSSCPILGTIGYGFFNIPQYRLIVDSEDLISCVGLITIVHIAAVGDDVQWRACHHITWPVRRSQFAGLGNHSSETSYWAGTFSPAGAAFEESSSGSDEECLVPPTTPPTTAATMTSASTMPRINQNVPLRRPQTLRVRGSGAE